MLIVGMFPWSDSAMAQEPPDALVKRVTAEVMQIARTDREIQAGSRQRIYTLVESKIVPHIDFERATSLAAGRHWRGATPEQRRLLTREFRTLLMYTYAGAMSQISDQTLQFKPLRAEPDETDVEVRSRVVMPRRSNPVEVSYRLARENSGWKIYDVNVLGVWLSETYKASFASEIERGGMDGLIATLTRKNLDLAARQ